MADHPTILVIEDERSLRENLQTLLQQAGYQVTTAATGAAGLQQLQHWCVDLVLTDLGLPDLDGFQVMAALSVPCPHTVIVVMSGDASPALASQALRQGAYASLRKPLDVDLLYRVVAQALASGRRPTHR